MKEYDYWADNWVVLKIHSPKVNPNDKFVYKVLAGWAGGFDTGNSWRINSGITKVEKDGDYYYFYGTSGSVYKCNERTYALKMNNGGIYNRLVDEFGGEAVQMLPEETDWLNFSFVNA